MALHGVRRRRGAGPGQRHRSVGRLRRGGCPGARLLTVEAQEESVRLAKKSARYNGLEARYEIRHGDFRYGH